MTRNQTRARADRAEAPSPSLSVTIANPTRLSDVQEWVVACDRLGMTSDGTSITVSGVQTSLTATVDLDDVDELS